MWVQRSFLPHQVGVVGRVRGMRAHSTVAGSSCLLVGAVRCCVCGEVASAAWLPLRPTYSPQACSPYQTARAHPLPTLPNIHASSPALLF